MRKAYIAIKYYDDFRNKSIVERIEKALNKNEYTGSCIIRDYEYGKEIIYSSKLLMEMAFSLIDQSELVIIECSEKGIGLGIEAGYAYAKGKKIVVMIENGKEISNTLSGIMTNKIVYEDKSDIGKLLNEVIERF